MIRVRDIDDAAERITPHTLKTPLIRSKWLSDVCGGEVYLKLESEQYTGSFKARGSLNKLMWLQEQQSDKMPVTASTGNHGLGFARALDLLGINGKIFLPKNAVPSKIEAIKSYNADIEFYGNDPYATEMHTRKTAEENDWMYVSPYNDEQVIAGQGTIGKEIALQIAGADAVLATVGGGGLISGLATYVKDKWPDTKMIGCQPANSPEMSASVRAGTYKEVESKPTLSDGSAGGFERDAITFNLCKKLIDEFVLISEEEIKNAIRLMIQHHSKLMEGAAAVAVASVLKNPAAFSNQSTVVVVCGANISEEKLRGVLDVGE
jgi:threonine dehydratase